MSIQLDKPWIRLTSENLKQVKGWLGVYQLGSDDDGVTYIGCADARSLFGLKGELQSYVDAGTQGFFRIEVTSAYQTRYRELLMLHFAEHQSYPRDNKESDLPRLGKLSPG